MRKLVFDFKEEQQQKRFKTLIYNVCTVRNWPVDAVVKDIALGVEGQGFDSLAGQIGHSVGNGLLPLRRVFADEPHHSLHASA